MVEKLFEELSKIPEVEAIALGGSRAGSNYDEKSDYDVYLYCTGDVDIETRREILSTRQVKQFSISKESSTEVF